MTRSIESHYVKGAGLAAHGVTALYPTVVVAQVIPAKKFRSKRSSVGRWFIGLRSIVLLLLLGYGGAVAAALDMNTASAEAIASGLKGVGMKKAEAIVAYRQQIGGFKQEADLLEVKGVGQKLLDLNKGKYVITPPQKK